MLLNNSPEVRTAYDIAREVNIRTKTTASSAALDADRQVGSRRTASKTVMDTAVKPTTPSASAQVSPLTAFDVACEVNRASKGETPSVYDIPSMRRKIYAPQSGMTAADVQQWEESTQKVFDDVTAYYAEEGYKQPNELLEEQLEDRLSDAVSVRMYLNENRSRIENYDDLIQSFDNTVDQLSKLHEQVSTVNVELSRFSSAEEYEKAIADYQRYVDYTTCDLTEKQRELTEWRDIARLIADREEKYEKRVKERAEELQEWDRQNGLVNTSDDSKYYAMAKDDIDLQIMKRDDEIFKLDINIDRNLVRLGFKPYDYEKFKAALKEKERFYNVAAYMQQGIRLTEDAENAADFRQRSAYNRELEGSYGVQYQFINAEPSIQKSILATFLDLPLSPIKLEYIYMTDDEIAVYNYYRSESQKAADEYLGILEDVLTSRRAKAEFEVLENNWILEQLHAPLAGLEQFSSGIAKLFDDRDYIPMSVTQKRSQLIREDLYGEGGFVGQFSAGLYDLNKTVANTAPSVLSSIATTYVVGKVTKNPALAIRAGNFVGSTLSALSSSGHAYAEAVNLGYDKGQARLYATLVGASEVGVSMALSGISSLGGVGTQKALDAINQIDDAFARISLKLGTNMVAEGCEEALQELINPVFEKIALGETEGVNWDEIIESFILGALSAGIMESGPTVARDINTQKAGKAILENGNLNGLLELAAMMPQDSEAYTLSQSITEESGTYRVGELFAAVCDALEVTDAVTSIQTQSTAETLTPEQVREQEFVKLHNDTTRLLEQRRAVENAPPHHAPILQSIMTELDALRGTNSATSATPASPAAANAPVAFVAPAASTAPTVANVPVLNTPMPQSSVDAPAVNTATEYDITVPTALPQIPSPADTTIDEGNKKAYNRYKRLTREQQIGLFDDTSSFNAAFPLSKNHERSYTVFYEADVGETRSRSAHRNRANKQLYMRLEIDAEFRSQLNELLGYDVMQHMKTGKRNLKNPSPDLVWHHPVDNRRGVELIFKKDHQSPDMQKYLHPGEGRRGGYGLYY